MKRIINKNNTVTASRLLRPSNDIKKIYKTVESVMNDVRLNGDKALIDYTFQYDGIKTDSLTVTDEELKTASKKVPDELKHAIKLARKNIEKFHKPAAKSIKTIETSKGVLCWQKTVAIQKVGLYIPGGSAPLFSTMLMLAIPAKLAGCAEIIVCTPPQKDGSVSPAILYTAFLLGIKKIIKAGGAQAIAAMAYGTDAVPKVDKIFGPGNQYVTCAKQIASLTCAIDMPAGPSELAVIADETCVPGFVAADLLSQAEHGADSQVILLSDSVNVLNEVRKELKKQLKALPRNKIAEAAINNSFMILVKDLNDAIDIMNEYAPEHLILACKNADKISTKIRSAGSVFIGNYSCESAGDYASGTNHTLPTGGFAKSYSGVSVSSFQKQITFQKISKKGIKNIGPAIEVMAEAEGLFAHKNAVTLRLNNNKK